MFIRKHAWLVLRHSFYHKIASTLLKVMSHIAALFPVHWIPVFLHTKYMGGSGMNPFSGVKISTPSMNIDTYGIGGLGTLIFGAHCTTIWQMDRHSLAAR